MSHLLHKEVPCQACKYPIKAELWSIINVKEDPELKNLLLGGELNLIQCESCKEIFYVENFLIYHDPACEIMAFVYPLAYQEEKEKWMKKTKKDFDSLRTTDDLEVPRYRPISLFGLEALVHFVNVEEDVKIQSEIVSILSKQNNLKVKKLSFYEARVQHVPPVLPFDTKSRSPLKGDLLKGLKKICALNDRLGVYAHLAERLKKEPKIKIEINGQCLK